MVERLVFSLALLLPVAWAQPSSTLADALNMAPEDAHILILSDQSEIVGFSHNLSRSNFELNLSGDFTGRGMLILTLPNGTVLEFGVTIDSGNIVTDGASLKEALVSAGFVYAPLVVSTQLPDEAAENAELPDPVSNAPVLPDEANGSAGENAAGSAGDAALDVGGSSDGADERVDDPPADAPKGPANANGAGSEAGGAAGTGEERAPSVPRSP